MKFLSSYKPMTDQQKLFLAFEKIFQVLKHKMEIDQFIEVKEELDHLQLVSINLLELKEKNISKFFNLYLSESTKNYYEIQGIPSEFTHNDVHEGNFQMLGFFYRIWEHSFKLKNIEIANYALNILNNILHILIAKKNNRIFIDYILSLLPSIIFNGIKEKDDDLKSILDSSLWLWYKNTKFNTSFQLEYLDKVETTLFSNLSIILKREEKKLFDNFVRGLSGSNILTVWGSNLSTILSRIKPGYNPENNELFNKWYKQYVDLMDSCRGAYQFSDYKEWVKKAAEFKSELLENNDKLVEPIEKIEKETDNFLFEGMHHFKINTFRLTVLNICSYAFFLKRYDYIAFWLEYNQPADAGAIWGNPDVFPRSSFEIFRFLANYEIAKYSVEFLWDDHHSSEPYNIQFILILIANSLIINARKGRPDLSDIAVGLFQRFSYIELIKLKHQIEKLNNYIGVLKKNQQLCSSIKINENWIDEHLVPKINQAKENCDQSITWHLRKSPVVKEKVENFEKHVLDEFHQSGIVRNIIRLYGKEKYIEECPNNPISYSVNLLLPKAPFIKKWETMYIDFGSGIITQLIRSDNNFLLNNIKQKCFTSELSLKEYLVKHEADLGDRILIGINNFNIQEHLVDGFNSEEFQYIYHDEMTESEKIVNLRGYYKNKLPVFKVRNGMSYSQAILIDKKSFGTLVQYNPVKQDENTPFIIESNGNIICFRLRFFSEDKELFQKELSKGEHGEELLEQAWLQIWVKVEFQAHEEFDGVLFNLDSK